MSPDTWVLMQHGYAAEIEPVNQSRFALANGLLGVRASVEEFESPTDGSYLSEVYDRIPLNYHERFPGFAHATDTRVRVANAVRVQILVDDIPVDAQSARIVGFHRRLDLQTGLLERGTVWQLHDGRQVEMLAQRIMATTTAALGVRCVVRPHNFDGRITLSSQIIAGQMQLRQTDDPRLGVPEDHGLLLLDCQVEAESQCILQRTRRSGQVIACAQVNECSTDKIQTVTQYRADSGVCQTFTALLRAGESMSLNKYAAYAWSQASESDGSSVEARGSHVLQTARMEAARYTRIGFEGLVKARTEELTEFWRSAEITVSDSSDSSDVERALRFNLFHLFQSTGRGPRSSASAKGLTGEGYEGHYFWDTEAFILPVLVFTNPERARGLLEFRYHTLPQARLHAKELNHARGALFPWRTISGNECSSHYPTGSAQYHINASIGAAVWLYYSATGGLDYLLESGAELLFETARIWLQVGQHNPRRNNLFCICGITGPDEYSALVDNNFYTNLTAQQHLKFAVAAAEQLRSDVPEAFAQLTARIALQAAEVEQWRAAASAMYLPYDSDLRVHAQDDSFLHKPSWSPAGGCDLGKPLLMRYHPLTLFRHQVCKQGDVILAMIHAGREIDVSSKRRTFDHYERLTVHDSGLSACSFSILAAEVGYLDKAYKYFTDTTLIDLSDPGTNTDHGVHMAAIAGSWLALVWGFGGLRCGDGNLRFDPKMPPEWTNYQFSVQWRGSRVRVCVDRDQVRYELRDGRAINLHHGEHLVQLQPGRAMSVTRPMEARLEPDFST